MIKRNQLSVAILFLSFVILSGCKKDDSDDANANLNGKWAATKEQWKDYVNNQLVDEGTDTDFDADDWVIEFKSNGTYVEYEDGEVEEEGTYSLQNDGKKLVKKSNDDDDNDEDVYTVKTLTSSDLVLYSEETYVENGNQNHKYIEEFSFKKK
jgi:hypothetical protein